MREAKHTPGPWETYHECGDESVLGPDGFMVADCAIFSLRPGAPTVERCRANARLIAAAPDMLAALRALVPADFDQHPDDFTEEWHAARAAIAKATGESK